MTHTPSAPAALASERMDVSTTSSSEPGAARPSRRRIAMFVSNYPPHLGGLEVMVHQLASRLARRHDVTLVTSAWDDISGESQEDQLTVHRLPAVHASEPHGVPYPMPYGPGLRNAMHAVRNADVVHAHGALYVHTMLAARVARRRRAPLVLTEHVGFVAYANPMVDGVQRAAWRLIGDRMLARAAAVTTLNDRVQRWVTARSARPVTTIGNGVDLEAFRPRTAEERRSARTALGLPEDSVLVLFAARAAAKKRLDDVLAIPRTDFTLVVAGARRGLRGDALIDLGELPHAAMPELYAAADLMVLPSTGEGFPLAAQEAIASGLPLVLRWDDGYASTLPRQIVRAYDSARDVDDAVHALVGSPAARLALAEAGRRWAEEAWHWDATVAAYEMVYEDAIGRVTAHV